MNVTFGLMPPLPGAIRDKKARRRLLAERALEAVERWKDEQDEFRDGPGMDSGTSPE
jgi:methylenetetrahydrofolate--tRNA-(uracil-5-)-methyltransferase